MLFEHARESGVDARDGLGVDRVDFAVFEVADARGLAGSAAVAVSAV